jgi:hypothetical protein
VLLTLKFLRRQPVPDTDVKKALDPSSTSIAYDYMAPKWDMIGCVLGGTATMREAGTAYLPQHPHESLDNYKSRLGTATLLNLTEITLESLVGKPFSELVVLNDAPPEISELAKDVDLQGNNLHVFCRQWFREGVAKSFCHVLVDRPRLAPVIGRERTLADDLEDSNRPYWTVIPPENVLFIQYAKMGGGHVPVHVRIQEELIERVGYTEVCIRQIRVLEPGTWTIFREVKQKNGQVVWSKYDADVTGIDYIPFVTFYANGSSSVGKPPLEDLAFLNIRHWQSTSDQTNILTVARFPMLAVSGAHDTPGKDVMTIGPRQLLATRAENGKYYYVEHNGKAIQAGAADLEKLEQDMASYGAEFLKKRPGGATATARALDSAEATSPLQDMTIRFMDAVDTLLWMTSDWMGVSTDSTVTITTDFGPEDIKDVDLRTLAEMRRNRDISRVGYIGELKRRGAIAETFDEEEDIKLLQTEPLIQSPFATGFNTDGSAAANVGNSIKKKGAASPEKDKKKVTKDEPAE